MMNYTIGEELAHTVVFNYYDWHVKAYAVYLLRQKGIYIEFDGAIK